MERICSKCNLSKVRTVVGKYVYVDENGLRWRGLCCPICSIEYFKKRNKDLQIRTFECLYCKKTISSASPNKKFCNRLCSKRCTYHRNKVLSPRVYPPKVIKVKSSRVYFNTCKHCSIVFCSKRANRQYCKDSHSPSEINARKSLKHVLKFRQPISKAYRNEIISVYENKGSGQVDHIIPRNHPDVCGLHVPWNLQVITSDVNSIKSNLWDGTMDNTNWVKLIKL